MDYIIGLGAAAALLYFGLKDTPKNFEKKQAHYEDEIEAIDKEIKMHEEHITKLGKLEEDDKSGHRKIKKMEERISELQKAKIIASNKLETSKKLKHSTVMTVEN